MYCICVMGAMALMPYQVRFSEKIDCVFCVPRRKNVLLQLITVGYSCARKCAKAAM